MFHTTHFHTSQFSYKSWSPSAFSRTHLYVTKELNKNAALWLYGHESTQARIAYKFPFRWSVGEAWTGRVCKNVRQYERGQQSQEFVGGTSSKHIHTWYASSTFSRLGGGKKNTFVPIEISRPSRRHWGSSRARARFATCLPRTNATNVDTIVITNVDTIIIACLWNSRQPRHIEVKCKCLLNVTVLLEHSSCS